MVELLTHHLSSLDGLQEGCLTCRVFRELHACLLHGNYYIILLVQSLVVECKLIRVPCQVVLHIDHSMVEEGDRLLEGAHLLVHLGLGLDD